MDQIVNRYHGCLIESTLTPEGFRHQLYAPAEEFESLGEAIARAKQFKKAINGASETADEADAEPEPEPASEVESEPEPEPETPQPSTGASLAGLMRKTTPDATSE